MKTKPKSPTPATARQTGDKVSSDSAKLLALPGTFYYKAPDSAILVNITRKARASFASCVNQDQTKGLRSPKKLPVADLSGEPDWRYFRELSRGPFAPNRRVIVESEGQVLHLVVRSISGGLDGLMTLEGTMRPALKKGLRTPKKAGKRAKGKR